MWKFDCGEFLHLIRKFFHNRQQHQRKINPTLKYLFTQFPENTRTFLSHIDVVQGFVSSSMQSILSFTRYDDDAMLFTYKA